jgi:hypothetical protein
VKFTVAVTFPVAPAFHAGEKATVPTTLQLYVPVPVADVALDSVVNTNGDNDIPSTAARPTIKVRFSTPSLP